MTQADPDIFAQVFGVISEHAANGGAGAGSVADWLMRAGLSAAAISQILNGVATSAAATPQIINYTQAEMRYLQDQLYYDRPSENNGLIIALILGGLILFASRD